MKKQKTRKLADSDPPVSEDDYLKQTMAIDDAREWEEWEKWLGDLKQLNKTQLIQLLSEAKDREDNLWSVLIRRNGRLSNVEQEIAKLQIDRERRLANQKKGRREKVDAEAAKKEAITLGVDSFYGLMREAIEIFEKNLQPQKNKLTKVGAIRAIIVTLLCKPNRSCHFHDQAEWTKIVGKVVTSSRVEIAENQRKRE